MTQIKLDLYATRFGNGNLTEAFVTKEFGFEMDISQDKSKQRYLLSIEEVYELKQQIEKAIERYWEVKEYLK
jgi:hypothetical protein